MQEEDVRVAMFGARCWGDERRKISVRVDWGSFVMCSECEVLGWRQHK